MITDIILVSIGFAWIIAASIFDIKTREIPDWISFSLIAIGLGIRAIHSLYYWDHHYILYGVIGLAVFFVIGNLMYYTKQWGGGDSKLLMGLGAVFGSYLDVGLFNPNLDLPFIVILAFNILVAGAVYGIIYGLVLGIIHRKKVLPLLKKQNKWFLIIGFLFSLIIFIVGTFMNELILFLVTALVFFLLVLILFFIKAIDKVALIKTVKVESLREGDWLLKDIVKNGKTICSCKGLGITMKDVEKLKKAGIKEVVIKDGLPFVPSFLIGMIISFVFGNLIVLRSSLF